MVETKPHDFHITIGAISELTPQFTMKAGLESEIRLIKSAVLYADHITLCSFKTSGAEYFRDVDRFSIKEHMNLLEMCIERIPKYYPQYNPDDAKYLTDLIQVYKSTFLPKHADKSALMVRLQVERLFREYITKDDWKELSNIIETDPDLRAIRKLTEIGLLEHERLDIKADKHHLTKAFEAFCNIVRTAVLNHKTYPMFDGATRQLLMEMVSEGTMPVSETHLTRARQAQLAAILFERLPLFDSASIDEIVDIRNELSRPLTRFRAALARFSDSIRSTVWDEDFSADAEQMFVKEIQPAILDIEDAAKSNTYLTTLMRKIADKPLAVPAGSVLAIGMSQLSSLPHIVSQAIGIGLSVAPLVYDATVEWKEKQRHTEQNQLFFYYRVSEQLKEN